MKSHDLSRYADSVRLVMYHKQATSARTRYLQLPGNSICAFQPLPVGAELLSSSAGESEVVQHPGAMIAATEKWLGIEDGTLELQSDFKARVVVGDQTLNIYLVRFTDIDPPFMAASEVGASFIAITEARNLPPIELEILRKSYEYIMEG